MGMSRARRCDVLRSWRIYRKGMASFADIHLDGGIARGLQRGDRRAQAVAYRVMSPTIMGMAVRILQDEGLAQEVVQDTFVELIDKAHTLKDPGAIVAWVRKVAVNHCYMRLRSPWHKRRSPEASAPELLDDSQGEERLQGYRDLERALAALPADTRLVIWLHDVEGYTHREIGELTGQTASYSKSQLARGYVKLTELVRGHSGDGSETDNLRPACNP
jgi:RNA polymerase sigma-70 factor (ECF subfamily)